MKFIVQLFIVLFTTLFIGYTFTNKKDKLPNIIVIFTDDQGYNDVGVFGAI